MNNDFVNHPGNYYIALSLVINPQTTDYHINKEHSDLFPDWNKDWKERKYFTNCVIKNLDNPISIKFHSPDYTSLPITIEDTPAIIEPFVFRDVFITNDNLEHANFDISFWNGQGIIPPPNKPQDLSLEEIDSVVVLSFYDADRGPTEFHIERSETSATSGFTELTTITPKNEIIINRVEVKYSDDTVVSGTQYWYRVRTFSASGGYSPYTDIKTIII